jgi:hypothetical protein
LLGYRQGEVRSDGEKLLVTKAGADKADPLVRFVVDDEFGDIAHKDRSFADKVMFWRKDKPETQGDKAPADAAAATLGVAPIDAATEADRIKSLIGDKPVVIKREQGTRLKLPGL